MEKFIQTKHCNIPMLMIKDINQMNNFKYPEKLRLKYGLRSVWTNFSERLLGDKNKKKKMSIVFHLSYMKWLLEIQGIMHAYIQ